MLLFQFDGDARLRRQQADIAALAFELNCHHDMDIMFVLDD